MIIQCEQCRTKFKLDDSKVPDKGVKVRCAKCRHVFSVFKEHPETGPRTAFENMLEISVSAGPDAAELQHEFTTPEQYSAMEYEDEGPSPDIADEHPELAETAIFAMQEDQETTFSTDTSSTDLSPPSTEEDSTFVHIQVETQASSDEFDFGAFDFGDAGDDTDTTAVTAETFDFGDAPRIQPPSVPSQKEGFGGLDFSGDDMFGEVVPPTPEESDQTISFDFGTDDFSASMGVDDSATSQKKGFTISETSSDTPFSLDEIDFGDELTSVGVQHVNPEELKPSQELLFAPLAEAQAKPGAGGDDSRWKSPETQDELPPLSIASRRKQSPLFTGLVTLLGIIVAGSMAFFGYSMFAGGKANIAQETGRISIRAVDATYVKNKLTGDLLVISGEAVNEFSKPRAAIQIKGMVYGAGGEVLSSKNAFCGNPLTEEQLSTMSLEKIEAAMANQFGDSLANMEVPPGKAIPFVIVIAKPPASAKDYGVEPAGSTVATGKEQQ